MDGSASYCYMPVDQVSPSLTGAREGAWVRKEVTPTSRAWVGICALFVSRGRASHVPGALVVARDHLLGTKAI